MRQLAFSDRLARRFHGRYRG